MAAREARNAARTVPPSACGAASTQAAEPRDAFQLLDLPPDLLRRVLCAACDTPAQLLRCGAVSRGVRRAVGAPSSRRDALTALWLRVMAFADPAAGLLPPGALTNAQKLAAEADDTALPAPEARAAVLYRAHALGAGGWFALAHALLARRCCSCGFVTRYVCWAYDLDALLTETRGGGGGWAEASGAGAADAGEFTGMARFCMNCACDNIEEVPLAENSPMPVVVVNAPFFDATASIVLDADELGGGRAAATALQAAVDAAAEGATIELRGEFCFDEDDEDETAANQLRVTQAAVRLRGVPATAPWRAVHGNFFPDIAQDAFPDNHWWNVLAREERASAEALGFPAAGIHGARRCVCLEAPAWLESLYLRSSDEDIGRNGIDMAGGDCAWAPGVCVSLGESDAPDAPLVLKRCWLTAYEGSGVVLDEGAKAALLSCAITNCVGYAAVCKHRTSLRVRGCRITCNFEPIQAGEQSAATKAAVAAANVVRENFTDVAVADDVYGFTDVVLLT